MKLAFTTLTQINFEKISEDFRRLNNNDPGTWPLVPKVTILIGLLLAVISGGWWFLWQDQLGILADAETNEAKLKNEFVDKKRQAVNLDLYRQQQEEIDKSFGALLKQLPNRSEVEALLVEVNQAGLGRGLQFDLFKPASEVVKDFYAELPISVKINGNYHDFGAFAADVAKLPRIVTLNNVSITPDQSDKAKGTKSQSTGKLIMEMEIKTFRYLDEEEIAQRRKLEKDKQKQKGDNKK